MSLPKPMQPVRAATRPVSCSPPFVAEVKSDLMGEQTILCGVLQTGALLCYDKMIEDGHG